MGRGTRASVAIVGLHISRAAAATMAADAATQTAATLLHQLIPEAGRMSRIQLVRSKPMGQLTI